MVTPSKHADVLLSGAEETQKIDVLVLAGLADAKKDEVICQAAHRGRAGNGLPKSGKGLDGMLRVIVIPGHPVVLQKCEDHMSTLVESLLPSDRRPAAKFAEFQVAIKLLNGDEMLVQKMLLQTPSAYCFKNGFHQ